MVWDEAAEAYGWRMEGWKEILLLLLLLLLNDCSLQLTRTLPFPSAQTAGLTPKNTTSDPKGRFTSFLPPPKKRGETAFSVFFHED